jgi:ATP-dependent DNA helicase RecG
MELVWFQGNKWIRESLKLNEMCVVLEMHVFGSTFNMAHPEIELMSEHEQSLRSAMQPVYPSTETLTNRGFQTELLIN